MRPPVWQIHNYITTISVKLDKFQVKSDHPWNAILSERDGYTERAKETARKFAFCSGVFFLLLSNPRKTFWCYLFVNSRRPSASSSQKNIQKKHFSETPNAGVDDSVDVRVTPGRSRPDCREIRCAFYSLACRSRNMIMRTQKKSNSQFVNFHCKIRTSPVSRSVCFFFRGWRCIAFCVVWRNVT